jgi:hypothetical protein
MHLSEILDCQLDRLSAELARPLAILETGSIRNEREEYRLNDGWSTLAFARWVEREGGHATSIDLDTAAADRVLARHGLREHVELRQGYSLVVLDELVKAGARVDFLFLDTDNDPQLILSEYLLGRRLVGSPGVVIIDDVDPGQGAHKGDAVLAWLDGRTPYRIERRTGTTYSTGVLVIDT